MPEIDTLLENKDLFNNFMYMSFNDAIQELEKRKSNTELATAIKKYFPYDIPEPLRTEQRCVLFRQVATPNFEIRRFLFLTGFSNLKPLLWEYYADKFTSNNVMKKYLGKIPIITGYSKTGAQLTQFKTIIDFNKSNGIPLLDVKTKNNISLIELHHELFKHCGISHKKDMFFDSSKWFNQIGGTANEYYISFMALFLQNNIWFENFIFDDVHERKFLKEIVLPGIKRLYDETGFKPLIVALEPTDIENNMFWYSYPENVGKYLNDKVQ